MKSRKIQRPILTSLVSLGLFLTGTAAIATSSGIAEKKTIFKITSTIWVDGRKLSSPRFITLANEPASITQSSDENRDYLKVEMVANDMALPNSPDGIHIDFVAEYKYATFNAHQKFQVLLTPKKEGTISFSDKNGHNYEMHMVAERLDKVE